MSDTNRLLLSGRVLPGFNPVAVTQSLARLLNISEEKAQTMLSGSETVIKRSLPQTDTARYLKVLADIGADARVESLEAVLSTDAAETPSPSSTQSEPGQRKSSIAIEETVTCPACQLTQPKRTLCRSCGADMPRMLAAALEATRQTAQLKDNGPQRLLHYDQDDITNEPPSFLGVRYNGRLNRSRYMAYSALIYGPAMGVLLISAIVWGIMGSTLATVLGIAGALALGWIALRTIALRLHDLGLSGKWLWLMPACFLMLITGSPIAAAILAAIIGITSLLLCILPGQRKDNLYGSPNGPNSGWIIAGAVLFVVLNISSATIANQPTQPDTDNTFSETNRLEGPIEIEKSNDPAEQETLVRNAVDNAAKAQGIKLDDVAREAAVQAYLQQVQQQ
ncbi:DUF805 domain-containing protein [Chitinimonas sp. PSY-7]|uniref:DUF805 domain-containing protein n=1 Tax=Chitinimonas sp. PSY-7 TaxID=3459088 RepID=UPI00403FF61B